MLVIFPIIKIFRKEDEIKMIKLLVLIGVLSQIPALYKFISQPASLLSLYGTGGYSRTESVFPNSNMYGAYLTVISLLNLFLIDYIKTFRYKLLLILVVQIPTFILLILTFSRRSWGLFILSLVIYTFFKKGQKKGLIVTISFVSIFMTLKLDLIVIFSRFQTIFSSDYASNSIRKDQFNELFNLISDNLYIFLLGMGPAITGPVSKLSINPQFTQIDNYFMLILLEYGVVGVLIYIILFIYIFIISLKNLSNSDNLDFNKNLIYLLIISSLFLMGAVGTTPISFPTSLLYWIFTGLILSSYNKKLRVNGN